MKGFLEINTELQRREQVKAQEGKDPQFRTEFRFKHGSKHWQYFQTYEEAEKATSKKLGYNIMGNNYTESPTSKQVQVKGKRGGWKKAIISTNGNNHDQQ